MEQNNSMIGFFSDSLILCNICEYLTITDKLNLASTSKYTRWMMNQLFKISIKDNDLTLIQGKSPARQLRFYFDRCLRILKIQNNKYKQISTIETPFKFQVTKFFEVGINFTVCLNNKKQAYVFKTHFLTQFFQQKAVWVRIDNVNIINCKGERLLVLKEDGSIEMISSERNSKQIIQKRQILQWTLKIPIQKLYASFNYAVFFPRQVNKYMILRQVLEMDLDEQQKEDSEQQKQLLIGLNMVNKKYLILKPPEKMVACAVGIKQAYFLTQHHRCFYCQFDQINQGAYQMPIRLFEGLKNKSIVKIASGYNYYIALERNVENLQDWDTDRVIKWLREIGFDSFVKIAQIQKLNGEKLKNMQRKYLQNVLGITKLNMQQKFKLSIEQHLQTKHNHDQLYGWGKNQNGQLGSSSANYIVNPKKIKMPTLKETQYIDSIFCGWCHTFIRTQKGRIHHTIQSTQKKKDKNQASEPNRKNSKADSQKDFEKQEDKKEDKRQMKVLKDIKSEDKVTDAVFTDSSSEEEIKIDHKHQSVKGFKYNKKKKSQQIREKQEKKVKKDNKKYNEEQSWVESSEGKAFFVESYKDYVLIIQCPPQSQIEPDRQKKLRTAKAILDKILWDGSLVKSQFKVGYLDKEMGVIQLTLAEVQMFQVKENRIKYFKKNNTVVWDRNTKFDNLY